LYVNNTDTLKNIRIVLSRTSHPGNIGAAARALKTMGLSELTLVNPRQFPHPEADARSTGAIDVLSRARVCGSLAEALEGCVLAVAASGRHRELRHETLTAREAAREVLAQAASHPVAIVFGNETAGLTSEEAAHCQLWAHIPADPAYASLNVAAAVQIFAYELRMGLSVAATPPPPEFAPATIEQVELLREHFERTMRATGFLDPANSKRLLRLLRRLLARNRFEVDEVNILRGFLKSVDDMLRK
jgi:tRNA/rRNA methyltransferase